MITVTDMDMIIQKPMLAADMITATTMLIKVATTTTAMITCTPKIVAMITITHTLTKIATMDMIIMKAAVDTTTITGTNIMVMGF